MQKLVSSRSRQTRGRPSDEEGTYGDVALLLLTSGKTSHPKIVPLTHAKITDKGYDAKANRDGARKRGICPVIPHKIKRDR